MPRETIEQTEITLAFQALPKNITYSIYCLGILYSAWISYIAGNIHIAIAFPVQCPGDALAIGTTCSREI